MLGNVWEWCHDWYAASLGSGGATDPWGPASGYYRTGRGGTWTSRPGFARSACRTNADPGGRDFYMGLRVAISL